MNAEYGDQWILQSDNGENRYCLASRQDEDVRVGWHLSYNPQRMKHYLGRHHEYDGYSEKEAKYEWSGYASYADYSGDSFYARIDKNAVWLHATVSGFSDGPEVVNLGVYAQFFDSSTPNLLPLDVLKEMVIDTLGLDEQTVLDQLETQKVKLGTTMILERYQGDLDRVDAFFSEEQTAR